MIPFLNNFLRQTQQQNRNKTKPTRNFIRVQIYSALLAALIFYNISNQERLNVLLFNVEPLLQVERHSEDAGFEAVGFIDDLAVMHNESNQSVSNQIPVAKSLKSLKAANATKLPNVLPLTDNSKQSDQSVTSQISVKSVESLNATLHQKWNDLLTANKTQSSSHTVLPHFIRRNNNSTLVMASHLGANKLNVLLTQLKFWNGPTSATVYIKSEEDILDLMRFLQSVIVEENTEYYILVTENLSLHIYLEKTDLPYPHNTLRQTSVEYLDGEYFVAFDVDFIPNFDCHKDLLETIDSPTYKVKKRLQEKAVFVLPAFERYISKNSTTVTEEMLPRSKAELVQMLHSKDVSPFHLEIFNPGHGPTNFSRWHEELNTFYEIKYEMRFEPYVLIRKESCPPYFTTFRGFGFNKFSWFVELDRAGYNFFVLRDFFVIHMNHPYGKESDRRPQRLRNQEIFETAFLSHLDRKYPGSTTKLKK